MGEKSVTFMMMKLMFGRFCALMTPYNITWTSLVLLLLYISSRRKVGFKNLKISLPQEANLLLGHTKLMGANFLRVFGRICESGADQYGLSSFFLYHKLAASVVRADHVHAVLQASSCRPESSLTGQPSSPLSRSFPQRVATVLSPKRLVPMSKGLSRLGDQLVKALLSSGGGGEVDVCAVNIATAWDVIGWVVIGRDLHCAEDSLKQCALARSCEALQAERTRKLFAPLGPRTLLPSFLDNSSSFLEAKSCVESILAGWLADKKREIELGDSDSHDILRLLLESSSPEEVPLDGLALYLQRGSAAISTTLSYLFVLIARHPRVEERVLQELDQVLGEGAEPSVAQLEQLVFCSAVVEEVLRLYPPSPLEERHLLRSLSLKRTSEKTWGHPDKEPVSLPPGTTVLLPVWHIHRSELNFHNAQSFDPDRFMPGNRKGVSPGAFLAFRHGNDGDEDGGNDGARTFSMLLLLSLLVSTIRKVKFECGGEGCAELPVMVAGGLRPEALWMRVSRRA